MCLQKYPPISGKVSVTNYLKLNAIATPFDNRKYVEGRKKGIRKTSTTLLHE